MSNTPRPLPHRPSAAAARRMRNAFPTTSPAPAELPQELEAVIERFKPKAPLVQEWRTLRPVVRQVLAQSAVRGPDSLRKHLTHLGYFYAWAAQRDLPSLQTRSRAPMSTSTPASGCPRAAPSPGLIVGRGCVLSRTM
jgi:hypothetical protein